VPGASFFLTDGLQIRHKSVSTKMSRSRLGITCHKSGHQTNILAVQGLSRGPSYRSRFGQSHASSPRQFASIWHLPDNRLSTRQSFTLLARHAAVAAKRRHFAMLEAVEGMDSSQLNVILRELQLRPENKRCVDCGSANPQWASVSFGSFMCLEHSGTHRSLGVHISFVRSVGMDKWKVWEVRRMQKGGNGRFLAYATEHGIDKMGVAEKYSTEAAAIYSAKLRAEATGEPYVAPVTHAKPKPASSVGNGINSMSDMGSMRGGRHQQSPGGGGYQQSQNGGMNRNGSIGGDMGGVRSNGGGGISSDMWAASNGNPSAMPSVSSMSYQQGGNGSNYGGRPSVGGHGSGGQGLNDVARQASRNINALASTVSNSAAFGTATQAAAQAGGMLSSWFSSAASQASHMLQEGTGGGAAGNNLLREDLRRNLASAPPASASGGGFVGFSSEDYMRNNGSAGSNNNNNRYQQLQQAQHRPVQPLAQYQAPPMQQQPKPAAATGPADPNGGWGGFDDVPTADTEPAKDAWGSWD
jgi:Putative GTPase activating protein for Arf